MCSVEILFFHAADSSSSAIPGEVFETKFINEDIGEFNRVKK
jgi:hypothetical protein